MNKNRIRGLPGRTSERVTKSRAIKGREGKSGGDAAKAVGLTSGAAPCPEVPERTAPGHSLRPERRVGKPLQAAAPTPRYGPAGDSAPRLRLKAAGMTERFPFGPNPQPPFSLVNSASFGSARKPSRARSGEAYP